MPFDPAAEHRAACKRYKDGISRLRRPQPSQRLTEIALSFNSALKRAFSIKTYSSADFWFDFIPGLQWLHTYKRTDIQGDLVAGLTVGVMAVPQVVSFAAMAGLPAAFGLYGCFVPVVAYSLFGGSPHLAVGPVALVSLLLSDSLGRIVPGADDNENPNRPSNPKAQQAYNEAAVQVSLVAGIFYVVLSSARLGFLSNVLSRPIISSFLTAGAILIALSQAKYILGYSLPRGNQIHVLLWNLLQGLPKAKWPEVLLGCLWLLLLYLIRQAPRLHRRLASLACLGPVVVAMVSITLVWTLNLHEKRGIKIVGAIQPGLPPVTMPWWGRMHSPLQIFKTAGVTVFVSILEAVSIAKALAEKHGYQINPEVELRGLAAANLAGAVFGAYPSTGSFARSAVSSISGGKTGLNNLLVAAVVGVTLLCLTPIFRFMPMNAMAAIVIMGVVGLVDFPRAWFYLRVSIGDFAVWLTTFLGFLIFSIDVGLALGVVLSQLILFSRCSSALCTVWTAHDQGKAINNCHHSQADEASREQNRPEFSVEYDSMESHGGNGPSLLGEDTRVSINSWQMNAESMVVMKVGCSLSFANADDFQRQVTSIRLCSQRNFPPKKMEMEVMQGLQEEGAELLSASGERLAVDRLRQGDIVLDLRSVVHIDVTAAEVVKETVLAWKKDGLQVALAGPVPQVLQMCSDAGVTDLIGDDLLFGSAEDAIVALSCASDM